MIKDCSSPDLTTVARSRARDGFAHFRGGGRHGAETVHHRQGKAVVERWLRRVSQDSVIEVEAASDTQRSNVADVMLTLPGGERVAFEVQYAGMTVAAWQQRHRSYRAQGIVDIWLWGHTSLSRTRGSSARNEFRLREVQEAAREAGSLVFFLNPITEELAVATSSELGLTMAAKGRDVGLALMSLSEVQVNEDGPVCCVLAQLARAAVEAQERRDAEAARIRVLALQAAEAAAEAFRREQALAAQRDAARAAAAAAAPAAAAAVPKEDPVPSSDRARRPEPRNASLNATCIQCGLPLDELLRASGVHVGRCRRLRDRKGAAARWEH